METPVSTTSAHRLTCDDELEALLLELTTRPEGDPEHEELRSAVVLRTLPLADGLAHRYTGRGIDREDLEQVARVALLDAVDRYRPGRGPGFVAFAVPTITGVLKRYFRDCGWVVRPPRRVQERRAEVAQAEALLRQSLGAEPTVHVLADELGCSVEEVSEARLSSTGFRPVSLEAPAPGGGTTADRVADPDDPVEALEIRSDLQALLRELPERDRLIIRLRFVDCCTQGEIGEVIGVSQMQVSRLLCRILGDLRDQLDAYPKAS
jgi:RNA polymerase sigma-B factor